MLGFRLDRCYLAPWVHVCLVGRHDSLQNYQSQPELHKSPVCVPSSQPPSSSPNLSISSSPGGPPHAHALHPLFLKPDAQKGWALDEEIHQLLRTAHLQCWGLGCAKLFGTSCIPLNLYLYIIQYSNAFKISYNIQMLQKRIKPQNSRQDILK